MEEKDKNLVESYTFDSKGTDIFFDIGVALFMKTYNIHSKKSIFVCKGLNIIICICLIMNIDMKQMINLYKDIFKILPKNIKINKIIKFINKNQNTFNNVYESIKQKNDEVLELIKKFMITLISKFEEDYLIKCLCNRLYIHTTNKVYYSYKSIDEIIMLISSTSSIMGVGTLGNKINGENVFDLDCQIHIPIIDNLIKRRITRIYDKYTVISCYGKDKINCIDKTDYEYENHKVSINEKKQNGLEINKKFESESYFIFDETYFKSLISKGFRSSKYFYLWESNCLIKQILYSS